MPTVLYFAVAATVHFACYPRFAIQGLPYRAAGGAAALFLSAGVAAYGAAYRALSKGRRDGRLVTTGLYAVVRHPLYASSILLILPGVMLMLRSWLLVPLPVVAYIAARVFLPAEEARLRRRFGEAFEDHRRRTPLLIPRLPRGQKPA